MKRLLSVFVLIAVTVGVLCSACSSDAGKNDGNYVLSPESFFENAVHSLFPNKIFNMLFADENAVCDGEISVKDAFFSDVETGERYSFSDVLNGKFNVSFNGSNVAVRGNADLGSKNFDFVGAAESGKSELYIDGLCDEIISVDLFDLTGVSVLSSVYSDLKTGFSDFSAAVSTGLKNAETSVEEVKTDSDNGGLTLEKTVYSLGKAESEDIANTVINTVYSKENALGSLFGKYFLKLYAVGSDNYERYAENLKNAISEADDFSVTVEKYAYKGKLVRVTVCAEASNPSLCRKITYSCFSEDNASLIYENQESGMPLFSAELDDGRYTFSFNNAYTVSFASQNPSDDMKTEITVRTPSFSEDILLSVSYTTSSDNSFVSAVLHDENETFGAKASLSLSPSTGTSFEAEKPSSALTVKNSIEGARGYDALAAALVSEFKGLEKLLPTYISISDDFGDRYAATIGEDRYSLSAYLYFLQQSRDICEYIAAEILGDDSSSADGMWEIVLTGGKTLEEYAYSLTEESYISSYYIIKYFNENGLSLSLSELTAVKNEINSLGKEAVTSLCSRLGCSEAGLRFLYSISYMQSKVFADIYGEAGKTPVTQSDVKSLFDASYVGVRFITLLNFDPSDSSALNGEELEAVQNRAKECFKKLTTGEISMDDAVREYSDAYKYVPTQGERDSSEYFVGTVVGKDGKSDAFTFPTEMTSALFDLKIGEFGYFEDEESGFWIFERTDIDDKFSDYREQLRDSLVSELQSQALSDWRDSQKYSLDKSVISEYNMKDLPTVFYTRTSDED